MYRCVWAALEGRCGNDGVARELYEDALRLDGYNMGVWAAYEAMERAAGKLQAAADVFERSQIQRQLKPEPTLADAP